jgi:hypothetical protein
LMHFSIATITHNMREMPGVRRTPDLYDLAL